MYTLIEQYPNINLVKVITTTVVTSTNKKMEKT